MGLAGTTPVMWACRAKQVHLSVSDPFIPALCADRNRNSPIPYEFYTKAHHRPVLAITGFQRMVRFLIGKNGMTKKDYLEILMLLSALESWSFANSNHLPGWLLENLNNSVDKLKAEVLEKE
jgi:hypothetical protein